MKRWTPPKYETHTEEGEPHKKNFVMACTVMDLTEVGEGSSKKVAKRRAAQKILRLLKSKVEEDIGNMMVQQFADVGNNLEKMTLADQQEQEQFRRAMQANNSAVMQEFKKRCLHTPDTRDKLKDLLQRIADDNKFQLIKCPNEERSVSGQFTYLIEMTTKPTGVVMAHGDTEEEAELNATVAALDYLKLMSK